MSFISKEEFEAIVKQNYTNLDKDGFNKLVCNSIDKCKQLKNNGLLKFNEKTEIWEGDDITVMCLHIAVKAIDTRRISFNQYKALCAFTKQHTHKLNTEYKQF